jgi:integrase
MAPISRRTPRSKYLQDIEESLNRDLSFLNDKLKIASQPNAIFSIEDIADMLNATQAKNRISLSEFVYFLTITLYKNGQYRTARAYRSAANSLIEFNGGQDLYMDELTTLKLMKYEKYMKSWGLQLNTISFYFRNLRAICNKAVSLGLYPSFDMSIFKSVYTGVEQTSKRALHPKHMKDLWRFLDRYGAKVNSDLSDAVALFLFCFSARGMSFVDAINLKKENIRDNTIMYYRRKTSRCIRVAVSPPMQKIINHFAWRTRNSVYIFPFLSGTEELAYRQYETALRRQNRRLRQVARILGIRDKLTTHTSRHSWATIAHGQDIPVSVICEALGHHNERTTLIYLASIESSVIDEASNLVNNVVLNR